MIRAFLAIKQMVRIKIKLELQRGHKRAALEVLEIATVPRPGDKIQTSTGGILEVIEVVHTPLIRDWDAVVVVREAIGDGHSPRQ